MWETPETMEDTNIPLVKGGSGRSGQDLMSGADWILFLIGMCLIGSGVCKWLS